jgi:hypothetical protein
MPPKEIAPPVVKKQLLKKIITKKIIFRVLFAVILFFSIGAACYFYLQTVQLKKTPSDVAASQLKDTLAKVSRLILLPEGETPTIASVSDPSLLKTQSFFDKSQKGDQVLIYSNAKEAILYRPSTNMIINVASVNIGSNPPATNDNTPATNAPPPAPVKK